MSRGSIIQLDRLIRAAWHRRSDFSETQLRAQLECICARTPQSTIQWDPEAGEDWARILVAGQVLALLRVDCPLVIVQERDSDRLAECLDDMIVVKVESMSEHVFSAERDAVQLLCVGELAGEFNEKGFSIDEFWWATV